MLIKDVTFDIIHNIGLWCKFRTSIAIISSCKDIWERRSEFYKQKQLSWYPETSLLNFWTPEQRFYSSGCQFTFSVDDITQYMETSYLYEHNNTIVQANDDFGRDFCHTFRISKRWVVIWYEYSQRGNNKWSITYHEIEQDINDKISAIKLDGSIVIKYTIIDIEKSVPCWAKWNNIRPLTHEYCNCIFKDNAGKVFHSGE